MIFKQFKIEKTLLSKIATMYLYFVEEENSDKLYKILEVFGLSMPLTCCCSYDKDLINLTISDNVNVEVMEKEKKFIRTIHLKETDVVVNSVNTLKKLLRISNDYDAILVFKSMDMSNTETVFVVNDNGHDYINFDKNKYDRNKIKEKINQILNLKNSKST
jgi:hypothetical protein